MLRGLGGVAVALPGLEAMGFGATGRKAARPPRRFVISFASNSIGPDFKPEEMVIPKASGDKYEITRGLKPLEELGIRRDVSVVTGLVLPWQETKDGEMPPGGRTRHFHYNTIGPQIAGTQAGPGRDGKPKGPTADQIVADAIAASTVQRTLAYRVQPVSYVGGNQSSGEHGRQSWRRNPDGSLVPMEPIVSPRLAFESLFGPFVPPRADEAARARLLLDERRSVLDLVGAEAQSLLARVGHADRVRMERHFTEIRALEGRLQPWSAAGAGKSCSRPTPPGADPPIGGSIIAYQGQGRAYSVSEGYSNEDLRADVLTDIISMAFACDMSRVASYMLTEWKCYMNMFPVGGWRSDMHELTHGAAGKEGALAVADSVAWSVRQWGKLVAKLGKLREADGSRILDHTALVLFFEGGHGNDPEGNRKVSAHSTENMVVLVGGRAGRLRPGRHLRAEGKHPASAVFSAVRAAGAAVPALGEIHDDLPALFA